MLGKERARERKMQPKLAAYGETIKETAEWARCTRCHRGKNKAEPYPHHLVLHLQRIFNNHKKKK